jgi:hypothetical protein
MKSPRMPLLLFLWCAASLRTTVAFTLNSRGYSKPFTLCPSDDRIRGKMYARTHPFIITPTQCMPHRSNRLAASLLTLPTCVGRTTDMARLGVLAAILGLVSQWGFTRIFQKFDKENASYTAHSLVALIFMILLSVIGSVGWWNGGGIFSSSTPMDRLLVPNDQCRWLATIVTGMLTFWDLPTSLSIPRLRKPDVMAHHLLMSITAFVAAVFLPMYYVFFYLGVSEISSIPLIIYDQLCVVTENASAPKDGATFSAGKGQSSLILVRTVFQILAALCFTLVRALGFTYVTVRHFIPDVLQVLPLLELQSPRGHVTALRFALGASIGFTALQLYWFALIVRTILARSPE